MRTLRLQEWKRTPTRLASSELRLLLGVPRVLSVSVKSPEEGIYEIRPNSVVGTLVWHDLHVLIKPKVHLENLFFLLGFRGGLARWSEEAFPYEAQWDFLRAIAWAFRAEMQRGLRSGISRGYEDKAERLPALRGRVDMARQLSTWQDRPYPVESRFQEYSEDIILNRVLRAANRRLLVTGELSLDLSRSLEHIRSSFADVEDAEFPPAAVPHVPFTRLNAHWEAAFRLARLILQGETLHDETGASLGTAFTVDMNKLFEKFVEEIVDQEATRVGLEIRAQKDVPLTDRIRMTPDLLVFEEGRPVAVGDAKYIELGEEWPHDNLYQLLAYCVALGLPRGLLIYASHRPPEVHRVRHAGTELEIVGIDMSGSPTELVAQARSAAQRLIRHAQRN